MRQSHSLLCALAALGMAISTLSAVAPAPPTAHAQIDGYWALAEVREHNRPDNSAGGDSATTFTATNGDVMGLSEGGTKWQSGGHIRWGALPTHAQANEQVIIDLEVETTCGEAHDREKNFSANYVRVDGYGPLFNWDVPCPADTQPQRLSRQVPLRFPPPYNSTLPTPPENFAGNPLEAPIYSVISTFQAFVRGRVAGGAFEYVHIYRWVGSSVPQDTRRIEGRVTVPDLKTPAQGDPLPGVAVLLLRAGQPVAQALTDGAGRYAFPDVPAAEDLALSVALEYLTVLGQPPMFRIVEGDTTGDAAALTTQAFMISGQTPNPLTIDISFTAEQAMPVGTNATPARLVDLGRAYYHAWQAWTVAVTLGSTLDLPVTIRAFSGNDSRWSGPVVGYAPSPAQIMLNAIDMAGPDRPMMEWHEMGHHVMVDLFANQLPSRAADVNHQGYRNPSSTDSWIEGFAEFFALLVARETGQGPDPGMYPLGGSTFNLDVNYLAWSHSIQGSYIFSMEEFAVAGLLWDLVDPADEQDMTPLGGGVTGVITATAAFTGTPPYPHYHDHIALDAPQLWLYLRLEDTQSQPLDAPEEYHHIFDIKHLYDVLMHAGVGQDRLHADSSLTALDEAFIAHGFFTDSSPSNLAYDPGEAIGMSGHDRLEIGAVSLPADLSRRSPVPLPHSYIGFQAHDAQTGQEIAVREFTVEVRFAPPFTGYSYSYQGVSTQAGRLFFVAPDPQYPATATIRARGPGYDGAEPLQITSAQYWQQMLVSQGDTFMDHTFVMTAQAAARDGATGQGSAGSETTPLTAGSLDTVGLALAIALGGLALTIGLGGLVIWRRRARLARAHAPQMGAAQALPATTGSTTVCARCGAVARPNAHFCQQCGERL